MKNIRINKKIRMELLGLSNGGESMDKVLSRLLDGIGPEDRPKEKNVGMKLSDETYQKLKDRQGENETLINVIERAIDTAQH